MAITPINTGASAPLQTPVAEGDAQVRRGGSLDRQPPPVSEHPALTSRRTDSMPRPGSESAERLRLPLEAFRTLTSQTPSSPIAEDRPQRILTTQPTFKDGIGETSAQKQKGKAQLVDPPLLDTKERSTRFTPETSASIDNGAHVTAGIGERRSGRATVPSTHSHRSHTSRTSRPSHPSPTVSQGGSSGSSHISSAGIGERRPPRSVQSFRDPATGSQQHTPFESQRFSFPPSGELQMAGVQGPQPFPIFWSASGSSPDTSGAGSPPRAANWRTTIANLARTVGQQAVQTASVVTVLQPNARLLKAAAGHLAHQAIAVGIPTFAREMLAQGLMAGLHRASPQAAVGLQAGMMVMNITLQVVRERREARDPNEAARAFHSLSADQWEQSSPQLQEAMRNTQATHSRLLTVLQTVSAGVNLIAGGANVRSGDATAAIQRVATDVKTAVYTTMRDSLQASFRMVGIEGETHGLGGAHLTTAIATYAAVQVTAGYVGQALVAGAAPEASTATKVLNGLVSPAAAGMSTAAAWGTAATVAGVKAAVNTVVEAIDWYQRTQHEANQGGARQAVAPRINSAPEHRDYGRLLDHLPGRMAVINTANAVVGGVGYLARNSSAAVQALIGNAGSAAVSALTDYSVSNTWQAAAAVRAATSPPPPEPNGAAGRGGPTSPPPLPEQNA